MKPIKYVIPATVILLVLFACTLTPNPAPPAADTPQPASPTPPPPPTATATLVPTNTRPPTNTPTITPTPGPLSIQDDFSSRSDIWEFCENCNWQDGQLLLGPYPPGTNAWESLNFILCVGCGAHMYYRVAVDATFVEGQVDRLYGLLAPMFFGPDGEYIRLFYMGLSPWQVYAIRDYDYEERLVKPLALKDSGIVNPGKAINHLEITVKPGSKASTVDISFRMNGKTLYVYPSLTASPSWVGLGMSFHSTTVAYDNFEYEELEE